MGRCRHCGAKAGFLRSVCRICAQTQPPQAAPQPENPALSVLAREASWAGQVARLLQEQHYQEALAFLEPELGPTYEFRVDEQESREAGLLLDSLLAANRSVAQLRQLASWIDVDSELPARFLLLAEVGVAQAELGDQCGAEQTLERIRALAPGSLFPNDPARQAHAIRRIQDALNSAEPSA